MLLGNIWEFENYQSVNFMHVWPLKVGDLLTPTSVVPSVNLFLFAFKTNLTKVELLLIITDFSWLYPVTRRATAVNVIDIFISQMALGLKVMIARVTNCHLHAIPR